MLGQQLIQNGGIGNTKVQSYNSFILGLNLLIKSLFWVINVESHLVIIVRTFLINLTIK